jgi:hypothetical protein
LRTVKRTFDPRQKPTIAATAIRSALSLAGRQAPGGGPWSVRTMARATGLSKSSVQRLWSAHAIAPHRLKGFKLSKDLAFEEKFWDVVGLYLNPPDRALLLCCDEKSQCQALERSQPGLPLSQGHIRTQTHDYYRHGTVTLFAALDYLCGQSVCPHRRASSPSGVAGLPAQDRSRGVRRA